MFSNFYRTGLVLILVFINSLAFGQKKIIKGTEVWPGYSVHLPVQNKWSVSFDYSNRYSNFFDAPTQWIARIGINYQPNQYFTYSAGFAYSEYFSTKSVRLENRHWQQVQILNSFQKFKINHRLRLEERFQEEKEIPRFNYRFRYQFQVQIPVKLNASSKDTPLQLLVADEAMVNFGSEVVGNAFDQNRVQVGFQYKIVKNIFITPIYQKTYQIQSNKKDFRLLDVWRTGILYKK